MRRVFAAHVKPGMVLAEHLANDAGVVQMHAGTTVTEAGAARIAALGYGSVAVHMAGAEDVEFTDPVPRHVMAAAKGILTDFFERARAAGAPESVSVPYDELLQLVHGVEQGLKDARANVIDISPTFSADDFFWVNAVNVAAVSMFVASKAGLSKRAIDIGLGALLCDIGSAFGSGEQHPEMGLRVLRQDTRFSAYSRAIVYQHHEKHDGSGYPRRLAGNDIDPLARMVAVACAYCSLVSAGNPEGMHLPANEAFEYVTSMAGFEYDRTTVLGVMQYIAPFPVGCVVELSTGERAIVTRVYKGLTLRPTVRLADSSKRVLVLAEPENQTVLVTRLCVD